MRSLSMGSQRADFHLPGRIPEAIAGLMIRLGRPDGIKVG
jgi:hypothetical protein